MANKEQQFAIFNNFLHFIQNVQHRANLVPVLIRSTSHQSIKPFHFDHTFLTCMHSVSINYWRSCIICVIDIYTLTLQTWYKLPNIYLSFQWHHWQTNLGVVQKSLPPCWPEPPWWLLSHTALQLVWGQGISCRCLHRFSSAERKRRK